VVEYLAELPRNATAAYMRVHPYAGRSSANLQACLLMADPRIKAEVEAREEQLRADLALTAANVIREICLVASADPRELSEYYVGACRYCHGDGNRYQRTPAEMRRDMEAHVDARRKAGTPDPLCLEFDMQGGVGWNPRHDPNPECGECFGEGIGYEVFKDTRNLSPGAARLFAGVKRTRDGIEIKTRSQDKSVELAMQCLGLSKTKLEHSGPGGGPIATAGIAISAVTSDPTEAAAMYQKLIGS
jgi:hypothetical protein